MEGRELAHVVAAILLMFVVVSFGIVIAGDSVRLMQVFVFSFVVVFVPVVIRKWMGYWLDARVEHEIWQVYRFGWKPRWHLKPAL